MHRNLKLDNILCTAEGVLKLSDFALSRIAAIPHFSYTPEDPKERERSGREQRRLWYRAPELLYRKKIYSFEVDMWSAGCLFGEFVLGEALFNGDSEIEQLFKIYRITGTPSMELMKMIKEGVDNDMLILP
jgi:serine/threonine protein kinase